MRRRSSSRWKKLQFSLLLFGLGAVFGGFVGIFLFLQITGSATISEPISAPTLSLDEFRDDPVPEVEETPTAQLVQPSPIAIATETTQAIAAEIVPSATPEATQTPPATPTPIPTPTVAQRSPQLFRIEPAQSQARFLVYETFPEGTAIGSTNQIAGDIIVDYETPANSQVGTIRINLRSLQTDDPLRDRSIRCCVLLTGLDEYEFGEFQPTAISQLPAEITFAQPLPIQITGDLTVRGVTYPATFDVTLNLLDETELRGVATAQVNRRDFGILNNADNGFDYHGVADEVTLEFEFVAFAVPPEGSTNE